MARKESQKVELLDLTPKMVKIKIQGISNLLVHKFSDKNKEKILDKQTHRSSQKSARDPEQEVNDCKYMTPDGKEALPAAAFKNAMVEVAPYIPGIDKKKVRGSIYIIGNLVPLEYSKQVVNESTVKINRGMSGDVRFRPEYQDWGCELDIRYNEALVSLDQIVNLLNYAGFQIGVGDWRPEKSGSFGMFKVTN